MSVFLFLAIVYVVMAGTNFMYYVESNTHEEYSEARKHLYCSLLDAGIAVISVLVYINS